MVHERRSDSARFAGSRVRASMMFQPCFLAVETKERMSAKYIAPSKAAGYFLPKLHHAPVAFGLIVGEGNSRIAKEAQCILFARREAQKEIMAGSARRTAAPFTAGLYGSLCQRLFGLMG